MNWLDYAIVILAVLYTAEVIATKSGPFHVFDTVRARVPLGGLTDCPWCLWPWLALIFLALYRVLPVAVWPFAVAGGAAALHSYTGVRHDV